ncbi:hypothetical protein PROFUN_13910 [Planoprotostelium fungivorum]|uniref:Uncharacterized protein n=1 Tax=Planoprotostelium fungivorum TaxID=1890364 RepID=A0A2P6N2U6_9EUKA|nr:hypothetical protein PROFUN_13910 [Planoprotostelium fungivorum]
MSSAQNQLRSMSTQNSPLREPAYHFSTITATKELMKSNRTNTSVAVKNNINKTIKKDSKIKMEANTLEVFFEMPQTPMNTSQYIMSLRVEDETAKTLSEDRMISNSFGSMIGVRYMDRERYKRDNHKPPARRRILDRPTAKEASFIFL